jgi:hypothetical protein
MTIAETIKAIKALGIPCSYNSEHKEFKVRGYYTDCKEDALNTAKAMVGIDVENEDVNEEATEEATAEATAEAVIVFQRPNLVAIQNGKEVASAKSHEALSRKLSKLGIVADARNFLPSIQVLY